MIEPALIGMARHVFSDEVIDNTARLAVEGGTSRILHGAKSMADGGYVNSDVHIVGEKCNDYAEAAMHLTGKEGGPPQVTVNPNAANDNRIGDWLQTYSGRQFWPLDPYADEIFIEDIAHALAMQCRYAGHCLEFYSVAEHSVLMAQYALTQPGFTMEDALWALLHDASETYLVDVPRPVKPHLTGYKDAEAKVMRAVCERFGLPYEMPANVHDLDGRIIGDERKNMAPCVAEWYATGSGLGVELKNWTPKQAEQAFLSTYAIISASVRRVAA